MPEDKANTFLRMIRRSQRGRLKVYLGYCAGVGKTYQMLQEGHRLKDEGIDVVIGLLETHGRADIAKLAEGMEVIPRRRQEYHGVIVEEMDVDAILARKPQVALIDELAHTNVPGSPKPKKIPGRSGHSCSRDTCHHYDERSTSGEPLQYSRKCCGGEGARAST